MGFIDDVMSRLDPDGFASFDGHAQRCLADAMHRCGMTQYPPVPERDVFVRGNGDSSCPICSHKYRAHPLDWRMLGYGDVPFLRVLCDGRRIKL